MQSAVPVIASSSAIVMAAGFLVNVVVARFSPLKYIFLTGHMMWILSVAIAGSLYAAGFSEVMIMVIGSVLQGLLMVIYQRLHNQQLERLLVLISLHMLI